MQCVGGSRVADVVTRSRHAVSKQPPKGGHLCAIIHQNYSLTRSPMHISWRIFS